MEIESRVQAAQIKALQASNCLCFNLLHGEAAMCSSRSLWAYGVWIPKHMHENALPKHICPSSSWDSCNPGRRQWVINSEAEQRVQVSRPLKSWTHIRLPIMSKLDHDWWNMHIFQVPVAKKGSHKYPHTHTHTHLAAPAFWGKLFLWRAIWPALRFWKFYWPSSNFYMSLGFPLNYFFLMLIFLILSAVYFSATAFVGLFLSLFPCIVLAVSFFAFHSNLRPKSEGKEG